MTLTYKVNSVDDQERDIESDFSKYIIKIIQNNIFAKLTQFKLDAYERHILGTEIIDWTVKPSTIDMTSLVETIIDGVGCKKSKYNHMYMIYIKDTLLPNTKTSINTIARFLDKGNEKYPGMHIFSDSFKSCGNNLANYWNTFVWQELHRLAVSEVIIIK